MKEERHRVIRRLLRQAEVETQEQLQNQLSGQGFEVTQATISRDIAELGLVRRRTEGGRTFYALPERETLSWMVRELVAAVEQVDNLLVVKASPGTAQGVAAAVEAMEWPEIVGSVGGDDTILVITRSGEEAGELAARLDGLRGPDPPAD